MALFGDKPVVVTMLGASNSGKTCYMSAMYSKMAQAEGLNGYCLKASSNDYHRNLLIIWEKMVRGRDLQNERFPPATQGTHEYEFTLSYAADKPIIKFDWLDVRGAAMSDVDEDPSRQKLLERLKKTDCLILCISGKNFKDPITDNNREEVLLNIDSHFINYLIGEVQHGGNNTPPSIAIIVTQYDHCKEREATIFEDVKKMFPILFNSDGWLVMICAVTLGLGLAEDISAPINPINVQIPVIFSLLSKMIRIQWGTIDRVQLNSRRNNKQNPASVTEVFRALDDIKCQTPQNNELKLAKDLKREIGRLSTVILTQQTNTFRFTTYLDGKQTSWKDILE
jgi:hypothetical protein